MDREKELYIKTEAKIIAVAIQNAIMDLDPEGALLSLEGVHAGVQSVLNDLNEEIKRRDNEK